MNQKECILGIDFGTTSLSIVLLNVVSVKIEKVYNYNTDAYIKYEDSSIKEQSLEKIAFWFDKVIDIIQSKPEYKIVAFGFTGQMHGIIGLDSNGNAVTNLVTWQDKSCEKVTVNNQNILERIRFLTGDNTLVCGYGIVTLFKWLKYEHRVDIESFCTLPDYFAKKLTGNKKSVRMSPSMAHSIGLFNIETNEWNKILIEKAGLENLSFPIIEETESIIGYMNSAPVVCPIGDNQASFSGSIIDKNKTVLLNVGTGAQLSFLVEKKDHVLYKKYIDGLETQLRPYSEKFYLLATSFVNGGNVYKSLFNFFKNVGYTLLGIENFDDLSIWNNMMKAGTSVINSSYPVQVSPFLEGQRKNPDIGASISNLRSNNFDAPHLIYGFLEGMALYYKTGFFPELKNEINYICGSGNGLKKNELYCKIIETVFEYPLLLTSYNEEAAVGAAIHAGIKSGIIKISDYEFMSTLSENSKYD
ncbi:sedoheptulokinase [Apibacter sp. HY039]|uniref:sedoheptulokinase n=1 Tax=Apibacter sp. HY039 TaxID=2501476 RepID=UPI000FEBBBC6|nr:FGGY family carbohydrate kinase [Apibacter sp. HY039]